MKKYSFLITPQIYIQYLNIVPFLQCFILIYVKYVFIGTLHAEVYLMKKVFFRLSKKGLPTATISFILRV